MGKSESDGRNIIIQNGDEVTLQPLLGRKLAMYKALCTTLGVVTSAAKKAGISRLTHYKWLESDPLYKVWTEQLPDIQLDFGESALHKQIVEGSTQATIFLLKCKGRSRGYVERQEINHTGLEEIKISFNPPSNEKEVLDINAEADESIEHQDKPDN